MSTRTTPSQPRHLQDQDARGYERFGSGRWLTILTYASAALVLVLGLGMRLYTLGAPFDRDSYDEGVYWQSLRAMSAGHNLYQHIFYSQPPFFLLSVSPFYTLFGQSFWSARLGVALLSLLGLVGAFLLGRALAGRVGALIGLLLLLTSPLYLAESQILQAEAPSTALMVLSVGLAYLWWETPEGLPGMCFAALSTLTLALGILCKLLALSALVPLGLLALAQLWRIWQQPAEKRLAYARSLIVGCLFFLLTCTLVLAPFVANWSQLWQMVVTFHTAAKAHLIASHVGNAPLIRQFLSSPLGALALLGTVLALWRRDWRVLPLLVWLLATVYLLWQQVPLFAHHLVALIPPLIALAIIGISPWRLAPSLRDSYAKGKIKGEAVAGAIGVERDGRDKSGPYGLGRNKLRLLAARSRRRDEATSGSLHFSRSVIPAPKPTIAFVMSLLIVLLSVLIAGSSLVSVGQFYRGIQAQARSASTQSASAVAQDLRRVIRADQLVITDAQFIAGLAGRNTPPALVDTSGVRIQSGYLTSTQLIHEATQPQVQAILFYTGRLSMLSTFHTWVSQHFHLVRTYGSGRELWVRVQ